MGVTDRHPRLRGHTSLRDRAVVQIANVVLRCGSPWLRCRMHAVMVNGLARGLVPDEQADAMVRRAIGRYHPHTVDLSREPGE